MNHGSGVATGSRPRYVAVHLRTGPLAEGNLDLDPGLSVFYGLNGAGKTTVLRQILSGASVVEVPDKV